MPTENLFQNGFIFALKNQNEFQRYLLYIFALILVPAVIPVQLITGAIVNALLIKSALSFKFRKVLVLCLIPSIVVASTGLLFGGLTNAMLWMLPFIWVGNAIICFATKKLFAEKKWNYFLSTAIGSSAKSLFLFGSAFVLFAFGAVSILFLTAFGILQLITAESGSIIIGVINYKWPTRKK